MLDKNDFYKYDINKDGFSQSLLTNFMKCPTLARNYTKGLHKSGFGSAMMFGSVFHEYMDVMLNMYKENVFTDAEQCNDLLFMKDATNTVKEHLMNDYINATSEGKTIFDECFELCNIVVPEYFIYWKGDFFGEDKKEWVEIEGEFNVQVPGGKFRGKRDGVYTNIKNDKYLFETKTKSRLDDEIIMKIVPRDFQVRAYMLAWYIEHNEMLKGVLYNVIRKPQLRKSVKETHQEFMTRIKEDVQKRASFYFNRYSVDISEVEIKDFEVKFYKQTIKFNEFIAEDEKYDMEHIHECNSIYGACQYLDYCSSKKQNLAGLDIKTKLFSELA